MKSKKTLDNHRLICYNTITNKKGNKKMKRVVTVTLTCTYEFDEKRYPIDRYSDDLIADIAYEGWDECCPDIFIEIDNEEEGEG